MRDSGCFNHQQHQFMYYVLLFIALILFLTVFAAFDSSSAKKVARIKRDTQQRQ